jgi:hypothetical protein
MNNPKIIIFALFFALNLCAQERDVNDILNKTLSYRGLSRGDISIPIEFFSAAEKSPTNDAKLMLPLVKDMMANPLRNMTWLDSLSEFVTYKNGYLIEKLFLYAGWNINYKPNYPNPFSPSTNYITNDINSYAEVIFKCINNGKKNRDSLNKIFDKNEQNFIRENLFSILENSDDDPTANIDIFRYNKVRDSSIEISKRTMGLLEKLDMAEIFFSAIEQFRSIELIRYSLNSEKQINWEFESIANENIHGDFYYYTDRNGIRIAIGGEGKNIYTGDFDFIIDLGGDDVYNIDRPPLNKGGQGGVFSKGFSCIIDMKGNDYYTTSSDFALAGGLFSSSFIFDKEGDDIYESKGAGNLGAAIGGLGLLYDEKGNDTYKGVSFSIGAGCFGVGLLVDREGNDFYIANSYSQGFGMTQGVGAIVDNKGNDSYLIDSRSLDIGRYNDHYISMCQGYGLGLRPFYAGGIGLIIEGEGNDIYNSDIFGQGGAYWYSLGAIVDKSGHDKYNGYQYSQGAGIHLAVGLLKDYDGWDFYQSNGVSQGCGHDFGYGMLWDVKGNDNYSAYSLSQGAGSADGIGILIDESGVDGYLNKYPSNTRGYGNPRREYGSIGVFLDVSGEDYYSQPGYDSTFINSSTWGVFNDYYYTDLPSQISGDNFKVDVDSSRTHGKDPLTQKVTELYSTEEYFIMAKTIEPRFSYWQELGFRKLIEDSVNSAQYLLTKLGTSDHRETQVMRVLSQKVQFAVADALTKRLTDYLLNKVQMTQPEVSFACYIFGETRNPMGKEILLQLTYDENFRIRSSAINALGKIKNDTTDTEFINKVSARLSELVNENSEKKIYNKDLAFALGNYKTSESFTALLKLLQNSYYGARFVAAENLKNFPQLPMMILTQSRFPDIPSGEVPLIAFLQSLTVINDNDFKIFISFIKKMPEYNLDAVIMNLIEILRLRRGKSSEPGVLDWYNSEINEMLSYVKFKFIR